MTAASGYAVQMLLLPCPHDQPPHPALLLRTAPDLQQLGLHGAPAWGRAYRRALRLKEARRQPLAHNL